MAKACDTCGRKLSFAQRVIGRSRCDDCMTTVKSAMTTALADYESSLSAVALSGTTSGPATERLRSLEAAISAGRGDFQQAKATFYRALLDRALADEVLTLDEERQLDAIGGALYSAEQADAQATVLRDYRGQFLIAIVNDGRMPTMDEPTIILKKGEVQHLVEPASLLKEVIQREFQAGSRGVSFRVMKGVSYRVGNTRGRMVEVGRSLEAADEGQLAITSQRVVFTGERKSIEVAYAKLLDMNVYTDGIQFHVTNRQTPTMFRVTSGPMIAAVVNGATQKLLA